MLIIFNHTKNLNINTILINCSSNCPNLSNTTISKNCIRKLRDKALTSSELDEIEGIGDAKKKELLRVFGSVENIKSASVGELIRVKGISRDLAEKIKNKLK